MSEHIVSAVFPTHDDAEKAIVQLRTLGVGEQQFSVVTRGDLEGNPIYAHEKMGVDGAEVAKGAGKGLLAGAGLGALLGLGAALIPVAGPFLSAGLLAPVLSGAAIGVTGGAIVGGTVGTLAGALGSAGFTEAESLHYANEVEQGGVLLTVHTDDPLLAESSREAMIAFGGSVYVAGTGANAQPRVIG
jgi:hypothetical protein